MSYFGQVTFWENVWPAHHLHLLLTTWCDFCEQITSREIVWLVDIYLVSSQCRGLQVDVIGMIQNICARIRKHAIALTIFRTLSTFRVTFLRVRDKCKIVSVRQYARHLQDTYHGLFGTFSVVIIVYAELRKMLSDQLKYYVCLHYGFPWSAFAVQWSHVVCVCYQNMSQKPVCLALISDK